jgi:hypothetical protein
MIEVPAAGRVLSPVAEPSQRVGKRWITLIALANLGQRLGYYGPLAVLLPIQVQAIARPTSKVVMLGRVTGTGTARSIAAISSSSISKNPPPCEPGCTARV